MSIEAMKLALDVLEVEYRMYEATDPETGAPYNMIQAITALRQAIQESSENGLYREGYRNGYGFGESAGLRQAIEQAQKQEPVALVDAIKREPTELIQKWRVLELIKMSPPQRQWVGLTLEEILETYSGPDGSDYVDYARALDAKLKKKNIKGEA